MPEEGRPVGRLGPARAVLVALTAVVVTMPWLGSSSRLSYHEALVAQGAREMLAEGALLVPTVGGTPWLEKPPLAHWLTALAGRVEGGRVSEVAARAPSALAAILLALAVATLAARRLGPTAGLLAGMVQATSLWAASRGRLADVDIQLAALLAWNLVVWDRVRLAVRDEDPSRLRWVLVGFFTLLGMTAWAKGVGFGAVLVLAIVAATALWDRDAVALRTLVRCRIGWAWAALLGLTWPLVVTVLHPQVLGLWLTHVRDRLVAGSTTSADGTLGFAGRSAWECWLSLPVQALPWTPLALAAVGASLAQAIRERFGPDRLLWVWAAVPPLLLLTAPVKNPHYLIYALPPWSIWAAGGLLRLGRRWRRRGVERTWVRVRVASMVGVVAVAYALGFGFLGPWFDRRGVEWAFYGRVGRALETAGTGSSLPLVLLYDDWDRLPYPTPFGPVPHDLAVRLYYLDRPDPVPWHDGVPALAQARSRNGPEPFAVLGRQRDRPALERLGAVKVVTDGPPVRSDRTYTLFVVRPEPAALAESAGSGANSVRR